MRLLFLFGLLSLCLPITVWAQSPFSQVQIIDALSPEEEAPAPYTFNYQQYASPQVAPDIHWQDRTGRDVHLADLKGYVVIVNFWATWCGPCVMEMPDLDALQKRYGAGGLLVAAVSVDEGGLNVIDRFYKQHRIANLPIFSDPDAESAALLNVRTLPVSFIVNRDGLIVGTLPGYGSWSSRKARTIIEDALREPAIHAPPAPKFQNIEILDVAP